MPNQIRVPNQSKVRSHGPTRYTLHVTQDIIDTAVRNTSGSCAVADAIRYQVPDVSKIQVDLQTIRFSLKHRSERLTYLTPRQVQEYIVAFDAGDPLEPFDVQLRNPGITPTKTSIPDTTDTPDGSPRRRRRAEVTKAGTPGERREGGRTPPRLATSTRREFGLRQLRANQGPAKLPWR